jgi:enoyl-CoA hydratase
MSFENLLVESQDGVVRLTVNRPKALNALNRATLLELDRALQEIPKEARVLVITGSGEKAFVAGADITEMMSMSATEASEFSALGHRALARLEALPIPVIAEVNGYALGGGCELMLACDFAIASDNARLGQPEVGLGVTPGFGGTTRLVRRIGEARARQLLFTGEQISGAEAQAMGLVNQVVPPAALRDRVNELAQKIVKNAPLAVTYAKRLAVAAKETDLSTANLLEQQVFGLCFATQDQKEGMRAFNTREKAIWTGK